MPEALFCGVEVGGTKLQFVLGDGAGHIRERLRLTVQPTSGASGIRQQIEKAARDWLHPRQMEAVGVGFGGPVHWKTGRTITSHQIEGWNDFPLADWLQTLIGRPVLVENDANTAALGEAMCGNGAGCNPVLYVTLGSGVGGGLVVDGRAYHGALPGEVEIGHVRLDKSGATVESRCSGWAVDEKIRQSQKRRPDSVLARTARGTPGGESRLLAGACQAGDPEAVRILNETAEDLAFGLSHAVHLFHPETIVLGGGLALAGEILRSAVAAALPGFLMDVFQPGPPVKLSALREDAVPVGALLLARSLVVP